MNCTELFLKHAETAPERSALFVPGSLPRRRATTYGELLDHASRAQHLLRENGVGTGDGVLLVDGLGPRMFAAVIAAVGMGAAVILVEPWMAVAKIERVIRLTAPKVFLASGLGFVWGLRVAAIRGIPRWLHASRIIRASAQDFHLESVAADARGILTFTSGTTGQPKGVSRTQGRLIAQHRALNRALESDRYAGADLCIFANFAFANLANGRASVIMDAAWKPKHLRMLDELPPALRPETLTTGPAFLLRLMAEARVPTLRSIHVGGAVTDCAIFERGFDFWPEANWTHVYGGSEAEPVATSDARKAVRLSRSRGYFQTLYLGKPVPEIRVKAENDSLWVAGDHVCAEYVGNADENRLFKKQDADGVLWHCMGDRTAHDQDGLWYAGRAQQDATEFQLEQAIYSELGSSKSFVVRRRSPSTGWEDRFLVGEGVGSAAARRLRESRGISEFIEGRVYRDRRHRARIDRVTTLRKAAPWLVG